MSEFQQLSFDGINNNVNEFLVKDSQFTGGANFDCARLGMPSKRKGMAYFGYDGGKAVPENLYVFKNSYDGTPKNYVVIATNGFLLKATNINTTFASLSTYTAGAKPRFETFLDKLFIVNGTDANKLCTYNLGTVTDSSNINTDFYSAPRAKFIKTYKNRMYLGYSYDSANSQWRPTRIYESTIPLGIMTVVNGDQSGSLTQINIIDNSKFYVGLIFDIYSAGTNTKIADSVAVTAVGNGFITIASTSLTLKNGDEIYIEDTKFAKGRILWDNENWFEVGSSNGDEITGFGKLSNTLVIFKESALYVYDGSAPREIPGGIGTTSQESVIETDSSLFFFHQTGIYRFSGDGTPKNISQKVQRYIAGMTQSNWANVIGGISPDGDQIFWHIGDVSLTEEDGYTTTTVSNCVLVFDLRSLEWFVFNDIPAKGSFQKLTGLLAADASTRYNTVLFPTTTDGRVYQLFSGYTDLTLPFVSAAASSIPVNSSIVTKKYYLADPKTIKSFTRLTVFALRGEGINVYYKTNRVDSWQPMFEMNGDIVTELFPQSANGNWVMLKFEHSSKNYFAINGFTIEYELSNETN